VAGAVLSAAHWKIVAVGGFVTPYTLHSI
jgi:hypothetical protein